MRGLAGARRTMYGRRVGAWRVEGCGNVEEREMKGCCGTAEGTKSCGGLLLGEPSGRLPSSSVREAARSELLRLGVMALERCGEFCCSG